MCTETRQELIVLSDVLGVSTRVEMTDFDGVEGATENTVLGPVYAPGSPLRDYGDSILEDAMVLLDQICGGLYLRVLTGQALPNRRFTDRLVDRAVRRVCTNASRS